MAAAAALALALDLMAHRSVSSLSGWLATALATAIIWSNPAKRRWAVGAPLVLVLLMSSNLVLRTSTPVIAASTIGIIALLVFAAHDRFFGLDVSETIMSGVTGLTQLVLGPLFLLTPVARWAREGDTDRAPMLRGLVVAGGVGLLLTVMLANGDAVFGSLLGSIGSGGQIVHFVTFTLALSPAGALTLAAAARSDSSPLPLPSSAGRWATESLMGLAAIVIVLGAWAISQAAVALGGADHILATENLTRADYARSGFFEMVWVVALVIALVNLFGHLVGSEPATRSWFVRLSTAASGLCVVLIGSAFTRLWLYIDAFGLTMLRLQVAWFLGWMTIVLCIVLARGLLPRRDQPWSLAASIAAAALVTTAFGWTNPEATVASVNLSRTSTSVEIDRLYLDSLGDDASHIVGVTLERCAQRNAHDWLEWNLSRSATDRRCEVLLNAGS